MSIVENRKVIAVQERERWVGKRKYEKVQAADRTLDLAEAWHRVVVRRRKEATCCTAAVRSPYSNPKPVPRLEVDK